MPLLEAQDPVLVGLWIRVAHKAAIYAAHRDRKQAIDIALMLIGEKPTKLESLED